MWKFYAKNYSWARGFFTGWTIFGQLRTCEDGGLLFWEARVMHIQIIVVESRSFAACIAIPRESKWRAVVDESHWGATKNVLCTYVRGEHQTLLLIHDAQVECLDKFQVMQHFHFGTTLSFEWRDVAILICRDENKSTRLYAILKIYSSLLIPVVD